MPGILPMKVIKVGGTSSQTRIAQACDRCRSKKIRCDGTRPSCTQCINVGFECKTSDKLSRRAFPRGYTESLEERVRALEAEVRELKDLLDEKDEKIDVLSRIHSHSPQAAQPSPRQQSVTSISSREPKSEATAKKDDLFKVTQPLTLLQNEGSDAYFAGASSGRALVDAFKTKVQETGRASVELQPREYFRREQKTAPPIAQACQWKAPPRLLSDQFVNIFFQEWAPLFPVLHRPTFLRMYESYVAAPDALTDKKSLAQLHLVFGVAGLSSQCRDEKEMDSVENQWKAALETIISNDSMVTLQCLNLAQIYCLLSADHASLTRYRGCAVSLAYRLGLHQSQKRFALGTLTSETRKKVFWTLYTLDCFSAAQTGLPKLIKEEDVHCEYPVDADDEYVTEKGFLPTLPGESTKISSALALFRAARILARTLTELYPASPSHEISFSSLSALSEELSAWHENLPPHLRLQFVQDKPSTNVVNSRSPILTLAYHYMQSLIHRPAVCASTFLGERASASVVALASSTKPLVQILQLLDERGLCFSFCLNKNELLTTAGFGLLFQSLDLDRDGKLIKCHRQTIAAIVDMLEQGKAPGVRQFRKVAAYILAPNPQQPSRQFPLGTQSTASATQEALRATQKQLKAIAARFSPDKSNRKEAVEENNVRRATVPTLPTTHSNASQNSLSSAHSEPATLSFNRRPSLSPALSRARNSTSHPPRSTTSTHPNLDYLSFNSHPSRTQKSPIAAHKSPAEMLRARHSIVFPTNPAPSKHAEITTPAEWERLIGSLDQSDANIYDVIYGGPMPDTFNGVDLTSLPLGMPLSTSAIEAQNSAWDAQTQSPPSAHRGRSGTGSGTNPAIWNMPSRNSIDGYPSLTSPAPVPRSVMSFSDESLSSAEEFASSGVSVGTGQSLGMGAGGGEGDETDMFRGLVIPASVSPALYPRDLGAEDDVGCLDMGFGL